MSSNENAKLHRRATLKRRMHWDDRLPRELVARLWNNPYSELSTGRTLQTKPRATVVRLCAAGQPLLLKYFNWGGLSRTARQLLRTPTAARNFRDGHELRNAGILTPEPRAMIACGTGPFGWGSFLLTDYIPGETLYRTMRKCDLPTDSIVDLARQVAQIVVRLTETRVSHNDFKPENLVVDQTGKVWLIDLEHMRRHRTTVDARTRNILGLDDLLHPRNWRKQPEAAEIFRRELADSLSCTSVSGAAFPLDVPLPLTNREDALLSVVVSCPTEDQHLAACLDSVRDIADELIVIDASHSETTRRVAAQRGCRFIARSGPWNAEYHNWADGQARYPWVLRLSPHERVDPDLGRRVQECLAADPAEIAFSVPSAPDYNTATPGRGGLTTSIRLYRRAAAQYQDVGAGVVLALRSERVGTLTKGAIYRRDFESADVSALPGTARPPLQFHRRAA